MKGCFLLFTISLLVMLQIQRGMLQITTPGMVTTTNPAQTTRTTLPTPASTPAGIPARTTPGTTAGTPARTPARTPAHTVASATPGTTARTTSRTLAGTPARTTAYTTTLIVSPSASFATTKKHTGAAPTLSRLGWVSVLIVLTNTFIQLFHLS